MHGNYSRINRWNWIRLSSQPCPIMTFEAQRFPMNASIELESVGWLIEDVSYQSRIMGLWVVLSITPDRRAFIHSLITHRFVSSLRNYIKWQLHHVELDFFFFSFGELHVELVTIGRRVGRRKRDGEKVFMFPKQSITKICFLCWAHISTHRFVPFIKWPLRLCIRKLISSEHFFAICK